jgi:serine/threonine-protein phosphatase PP1 catalytic subunit
LSPTLESLDQLRSEKRPLDIPEDGTLTDLLWADPIPDLTGYRESDRGTSFFFGKDVVKEFLEKNNFDLLCRAHQCVPNGFDFPFEGDQSTLTIFSAPNYCGEFGNKGAMLKVDETLRCSFEFLDPPAQVQAGRPDTAVTGKDAGRAKKMAIST